LRESCRHLFCIEANVNRTAELLRRRCHTDSPHMPHHEAESGSPIRPQYAARGGWSVLRVEGSGTPTSDRSPQMSEKPHQLAAPQGSGSAPLRCQKCSGWDTGDRPRGNLCSSKAEVSDAITMLSSPTNTPLRCGTRGESVTRGSRGDRSDGPRMALLDIASRIGSGGHGAADGGFGPLWEYRDDLSRRRTRSDLSNCRGRRSCRVVSHRALPDLQRMKLWYPAAVSSAPRSVVSWCN
jgi:hypothetical protein